MHLYTAALRTRARGWRTLQWLTYSVDKENTRRYCSACERSAGSCTGGRCLVSLVVEQGVWRTSGAEYEADGPDGSAVRCISALLGA